MEVRAVNEIDVRSFDKPDEIRPFHGKGMAEVVTIADRQVLRGTFEPGWRWSVNVKPIAGTEFCEVSHLIYVLRGRMRIHMRDGSEREVDAGELAAIPPGHDAEVVGSEACVSLDFAGMGTYGKGE